MEELRKVARVVAKRLPGAPHETLLVLDATIGQNAVQQAKIFAEAVPVSGLVLTKLDGTARGGVVIAVHEAIDVPVKFLGVGEAAEDLEAFDATAFSRELLSGSERPPSERRSFDSGGGRRSTRHARHLSQGVGPARRRCALGITTAGDLLYHVPHRYEDASTVTPIKSLEPGMHGTVVGTVISKGVLPTRKGLRIFQAVLRDETGMIEVSWPGQPFLDRTIGKGDVLLVSGNVRFFHGRQLQPREYVNLGADEHATAQGRCFRSIRPQKGCRSR
jgi:hypothetical protein